MLNPIIQRTLLVLFFISTFSHAQKGLKIFRTSGDITIDARMDEQDWFETETANEFIQFFPTDSILANAQTEIRMTYDDDNIYIIAKMFNVGERSYVTPSLRRDFSGGSNDVITVVLDTYGDGNNAFFFGVNPFGVQREGLIGNGGADLSDSTFDLGWDNIWYSEAKIYEEYWMVEMAIPFKSIRYKKNLDRWKVNFYRFDSEPREISTWTRIPLGQTNINLAFTRDLIWDTEPKKPSKNITLIPYSILNNSKNFQIDFPTENKINLGGDAKIVLAPSMTLDLTLNPDFSQVEVDQQVTNLDRFEIFFPERRQFFLENSDLFAGFGVDGNRPFFSRRIGVVRDESTGQNLQNPIYAGFRLNGKLNKNLRIGLLDMQLEENEEINLPSTNYLVAAFQQKFLDRSYLSAAFINKQAFVDSIGASFTLSPAEYDRTFAFDMNLATADSKWSGKLFYHRNIDNLDTSSKSTYGLVFNYITREFEIRLNTQSIGKGYDPAVGFVRRRNIFRNTASTGFNFYPKNSKIQRHGPSLSFDLVKENDSFRDLDNNIGLNYFVNYKSSTFFDFGISRQYTYLLNSFDPSGIGGEELPSGTDYSYSFFTANFSSDARRKFFFDVSTQLGQYFNGELYNLSGSFGYRYQPFGFTSINFSYNKIHLPAPFKSADLFLLGSRFDFTFTKNFFWTTFVQLNSQIENLNINSRLQWRFKPVSDIFLVYTDNYFVESQTENGGFILPSLRYPRQRALVLKITYWLNL